MRRRTVDRPMSAASPARILRSVGITPPIAHYFDTFHLRPPTLKLRCMAHHCRLIPCSLGILMASGCASRSAMVALCEPRANGTTHDIHLSTNDAFFSTAGGVATFLIDLPLPGAKLDPHYRLYMRLGPDSGRHLIGAPIASGGFDAAVLIHLKGLGSGMTYCVSGSVTI